MKWCISSVRTARSRWISPSSRFQMAKSTGVTLNTVEMGSWCFVPSARSLGRSLWIDFMQYHWNQIMTLLPLFAICFSIFRKIIFSVARRRDKLKLTIEEKEMGPRDKRNKKVGEKLHSIQQFLWCISWIGIWSQKCTMYWFVWWIRVCVVPLFQANRHSLIASHSHRRKVQLRRQWDGTEDNSPITPPSLPHQAQNTHWWYGVYWSLLLAGNYCSSDHHHSLFSRYFSLWKFWEDSDSCRVSVGVVVTVWLKISGKFSSLTMLSHSVLCLTNTSSNLLVPSKPTWKLEQKLTFFSNSPACIFFPKCTSYLTQISNCLIGSS